MSAASGDDTTDRLREYRQRMNAKQFDSCEALREAADEALREYRDFAERRRQFDDDRGMLLDTAEEGVDLLNAISGALMDMDCDDSEPMAEHATHIAQSDDHDHIIEHVARALEDLDVDADADVQCVFASENNIEEDLEAIIESEGVPDEMALARGDADRLVACLLFVEHGTDDDDAPRGGPGNIARGP